MTWIDLPLGTQELALNADGSMEWNAALQLAMGDPAWVDVMWDATQRTLGIRAVNSATGIPVYKEPKAGEYSIATAAILNTAGISVDAPYAAEPDRWIQSSAGGGGLEPWFGFNAIYYITLPLSLPPSRAKRSKPK